MNELVKIHNDFTNSKLTNMSAKELDLLMAICVKVKNQHDNVVEIQYGDLQKLSNYKQYNLKDLRKDLVKMNENLIRHFVISYEDNDGASVTTSLFKEFRRYDNRIQVQIADKLLYLLNDLTSNFTTFELQEFVKLQSKFSKRLYKLLKQYRSTGKYVTTKEQFYIDMDIPESYGNNNFNRQVLSVALKECQEYFNGLTVEVQKGGRGGAVKGYVFTFEKEKNTRNKTIKATKNSNKFNDFQQNDYNFDELEKSLLSN